MRCSSSIESLMQRWSTGRFDCIGCNTCHHQNNEITYVCEGILFDLLWGSQKSSQHKSRSPFVFSKAGNGFWTVLQSELLMLPHLITSAAAFFFAIIVTSWSTARKLLIRCAGAMVMCYRCNEQKAILQNLVWLVVWKELGWEDESRCSAWESLSSWMLFQGKTMVLVSSRDSTIYRRDM